MGMTQVNKIGMYNPPTEKVEDILCSNVGYNLPSSPEKHILSKYLDIAIDINSYFTLNLVSSSF